MTPHDPMCLSQEVLPNDLPRFCDCERVARIRADEREKAHVHNTGTSSPDACCECCYDVGSLERDHLAARRRVKELADERDAAKARTVEWMDRYNAQVEAERQSMTDLRAKVEAMHVAPTLNGTDVVWRSDVLALLEEKP